MLSQLTKNTNKLMRHTYGVAGVQFCKLNTGCPSLHGRRGEEIKKEFERLGKVSSEWGFSPTHLISKFSPKCIAILLAQPCDINK